MIIRQTGTKVRSQLKKQTTNTAIIPNSLIIKILDGGCCHIEFRKMTISGAEYRKRCDTAYSLYVVESVSDDYNF